MPRLRGYMPPLPHAVTARHFDDLSFTINMAVETAGDLKILEEHMKTCHEDFHHPHRCQLLEVQATCNERIAELQELLGLEDN